MRMWGRSSTPAPSSTLLFSMWWAEAHLKLPTKTPRSTVVKTLGADLEKAWKRCGKQLCSADGESRCGRHQPWAGVAQSFANCAHLDGRIRVRAQDKIGIPHAHVPGKE